MGNLWTDIGKTLARSGNVYLTGMKNTLLLAVIATLIGCVIGFACGILETVPYEKKDPFLKRFFLKLARILLRIYVEVFRGTPMILQAVFIFYGVPYLFGISFRSIFGVSILVVSINTGAYMAESVRGGIMSVDPGQTEGAKALGMNHFQTMLYVILPQTLRNIMPQIGNNYIINVKDTSVMFIIGFMEFFSAHKMVTGTTFKYFPSAVIEMAGYLLMTFTASLLLRFLERKLAGRESYELVNRDQLAATAGTYNYPVYGTPFDEQSREFGGRK